MTRVKLIAASFVLAAMGSIPSAGAETPQSGELTKGEAKLAKMLEGRVAGEPQRCIRSFPQVNLTVIDDTALVYRSGRTLYVNVPKNPGSIDDNDTLVRRTSFGSRLCNTDIITTVDQGSGFMTGTILLGEFVPYTKAEAS